VAAERLPNLVIPKVEMSLLECTVSGERRSFGNIMRSFQIKSRGRSISTEQKGEKVGSNYCKKIIKKLLKTHAPAWKSFV
jgi:hypothetical protein